MRFLSKVVVVYTGLVRLVLTALGILGVVIIQRHDHAHGDHYPYEWYWCVSVTFLVAGGSRALDHVLFDWFGVWNPMMIGLYSSRNMIVRPVDLFWMVGSVVSLLWGIAVYSDEHLSVTSSLHTIGIVDICVLVYSVGIFVVMAVNSERAMAMANNAERDVAATKLLSMLEAAQNMVRDDERDEIRKLVRSLATETVQTEAASFAMPFMQAFMGTSGTATPVPANPLSSMFPVTSL